MVIELLIDQIYEAAVNSERWIAVLDQLAALVEAEGALLFAAAPGRPRWLSSAKIRSRIQAWADGPFYLNNPRSLVPTREPRFLTDLDVFTREELDREPYYTNFLRPNGLGWCVATSFQSTAGDTLILSIERAYAKGPVPRDVAEQLDSLRPHLARAIDLSARFSLERARVCINGLGLIGVPAAILAPGGKVVAANEALLGYGPEVRIRAGDRLEFANPKAQELLVTTYSYSAAGGSVPVPRSVSRAAFIAHVVPLLGGSRDFFSGAELLLYITPFVQQAGPPPEILQTLFDLSPAEARVAALIAQGSSVQEIAEKLAVQANTVRVQLKSVFAKTGTSRQAELASLLRLSTSVRPDAVDV